MGLVQKVDIYFCWDSCMPMFLQNHAIKDNQDFVFFISVPKKQCQWKNNQQSSLRMQDVFRRYAVL